MSEQIFKALIKNDNDEALSEFKSAIQQKLDTAMNVRRIGLTSEIFNGENSVPVTEEAKLEEEEVELDEAKEVTPKDVEDHLVKTGVNPKDAKDAVKKGFDYANKKYGGSTHKAAVKKIAEVVWSLHEEVELEEAVSASKFVKGGDDKIKQSEVDMLLGKIYDDSKLTKALISSKAYGDGESNPKKKNPYKKDTIDFHLYQLGQQVELSRR